MKVVQTGIRTLLTRHLGRHGEPPREYVASAVEHVWHRLEPEVVRAPVDLRLNTTPRVRWRLNVAAAAAAAVVILASAVSIGRFTSMNSAQATVETVDGSLFRIVEGSARALRVGASLGSGDVVRTNGGAGAMLALIDGSRVEMRSQSELGLEQADDGVRIRLERGGIIVNAAKRSTGHLYVQTKDVTVSVVGTVFLVNAEEAGSRVAVIEGEVRVQQGATEKRLLPGEQVVTSPMMAPQLVRDEIGWSRNAETHLTLLEQLEQAPPPKPQQPRHVFEAASVRPTSLARGGGRGGGSGVSPCSGGYAEIDPRRFAISNTTLFTLITMAHQMGACPNVAATGRLTGGPSWAGSDAWDIQAVIPEGVPGTTRQAFNKGEAPALQEMFQNLLADRFKLSLRHETKEMLAFVLTTGKDGLKLPPSSDEVASTGMGPRIQNGRVSVGLNSNKMSMARLAGLLGAVTGDRPVLDRTGISGEFNINISFVPPHLPSPLLPATSNNGLTVSGPSLFGALEDIGLELKDVKIPLENWVIEHVERPSEN